MVNSMVYTCPLCGSDELIWDYAHGYIVCSNCGLVIERIIVEDKVRIDVAEENTKTRVVDAIRKSREVAIGMRFRMMKKLVREYEKIVRSVKPGVIIDVAALERKLLSGEKVRILRHRADEVLMQMVSNDSELRLILRVIDRDPILGSRTFRGKVAIALIVKKLVKGENLDLNEIAKVTSISKTHARRLYRQLLPQINKIVDIVKKLLGCAVPTPT